MAKQEDQNGRIIDWEKELGDIDFKGFRNPEDLLNQVVDEQAKGTVAQREIWRKIRTELSPYEERLHKQTRSIIEAPLLPRGVKKDLIKHKYSFTIKDDHGQLKGIILTAQRLRGNWFCERFQVDGNIIYFNKAGIISKVIADAREEFHKKQGIKRTVQFCVDKPESMGYITPSGYFREIGGDGTILGESASDFATALRNSVRAISFASKE